MRNYADAQLQRMQLQIGMRKTVGISLSADSVRNDSLRKRGAYSVFSFLMHTVE